ncbi:ABC-type branched-subunit amino acid transport system ATPase component [Paenibacillus sp. V4I7]|nr:ABC-type branched-subunit amino acid transport system ATPase component [Paenibacillus sp. V4I7]MDQ0917384.1 ABC-type branched-subunit amino acid transport system ATPase component [Paenibacillus sp. V4I5]
MNLLEVNGLKTFYGKIQAVKGVSLTVKQGEIVALLGANGGASIYDIWDSPYCS